MSNEIGDWRHRSACKDEDPEIFFTSASKEGTLLAQEEVAKAVCRRCVVIDACLVWALETDQDIGILANTNEYERRALKRRKTQLSSRTAL